MKASLLKYENGQWADRPGSKISDRHKIHLLLCFGDKIELGKNKVYFSLRERFPHAEIVMSSTAGEIYQQAVLEGKIIAVAIEFSKTVIRAACVNIRDYANSFDAAVSLRKKLKTADLTYIMVLSDGAIINGSEMVKGFNDGEENKILITGGMAGDGSFFKSTLVGLNEEPSGGNMLVIGFYGKDLVVNHGSFGGWEVFGLEKEVTMSNGNVLKEIDQINALDLYKKYLGPEAEQLPKSALLFPLSVTLPGSLRPVVRTILSIDESEKTMIFAGDIPLGSKVRFMKANMDKIVVAAATAANQTLENGMQIPGFALLVSCVGRKLVLGCRTEEEIEAVGEVFGEKTVLAGFYSYGEISPFAGEVECHLHNQTMTITSFYEIP